MLCVRCTVHWNLYAPAPVGFAGFAAGAGTKDGFHSPALALSFEGGFAGAAAFAVNTGENCGGPVFLDGFVFCLAFLPVAWSFASRSRRAGEPAIFEVGGMGSKVSCLPWLPKGRHALFLCDSKSGEQILVCL